MRITILILITIATCLLAIRCNQSPAAASGMVVPQAPEYPFTLVTRLEAAYPTYLEPTLEDRFFKLADIEPLLKALPDPFEVREVGRSVEDRPIYQVSWGNGSTDVLLWSQMHGNEPTATAALFDVFRFLDRSGDGFDEFREELRRTLRLTFIPMLNPDGAERYQRRNALGVDINRDALRLESPEARILKTVRDQLAAEWGFNLHDQNPYYGVGYPPQSIAALSFLAPAFDFEKSVDATRKRAIQLIGWMTESIDPYAASRIAKYNDDFEPRAFGDNMQKWGTSTILIESGGYPDDPEKQVIRKLNFLALLSGFFGISTEGYTTVPQEVYEAIPYNDFGGAVDLLLREVQVEVHGGAYKLDIAYNRREQLYNENRAVFYRGSITDVGDLSTNTAYHVVEPQQLRARLGKVYPQVLTTAQVERLRPEDLYQQGYTAVQLSNWSTTFAANYQALHLLRDGRLDQQVIPGQNPDLLLYDNANRLRYVVVNAKLIEL